MSREVEKFVSQDRVDNWFDYQECCVQFRFHDDLVKLSPGAIVRSNFIDVESIDLHGQSHVVDESCEAERRVDKCDGSYIKRSVGVDYVEGKLKCE